MIFVSKRQKILLTAIVSAALVTLSIISSYTFGSIEVVITVVATYFLSVWALQPDFSGEEYVVLLALPTLMSLGVVLLSEIPNFPVPLVYFIPPIYGVGLYVTLLVENIFHVSARSKLIPLLRAARTVGYLLTLVVVFIVSTLVFSEHFPSYLNAILMFIAGGILVGQALWQATLTSTNRINLILATLISSLVYGEMAFVISFWPARALGSGLVMTTVGYFLIGLIQHEWQNNLNRRAVTEYVLVGTAVFLLLIFTTSWTG